MKKFLVASIAAAAFCGVTSVTYAQFNPQPDPPARSKTKTNDLKLNTYKGGDDKTIHIVPGEDKGFTYQRGLIAPPEPEKFRPQIK